MARPEGSIQEGKSEINGLTVLFLGITAYFWYGITKPDGYSLFIHWIGGNTWPIIGQMFISYETPDPKGKAFIIKGLDFAETCVREIMKKLSFQCSGVHLRVNSTVG